MPELRTLTCPTCGAPLSITGEEIEVKCTFCGNTMVVPQEMRTKHTPDPAMQMQSPFVVIQQPSIPNVEITYPVGRSAAGCAGLGCGGAVAIMGAVIGIIAAIIGVAVSVIPAGQISNVISQVSTSMPAFSSVTTMIAPPFSFGGTGTGDGLFSDARYIAIDNKSNVYVSDFKTGLIQKFDADGNYLTGWQVPRQNKVGPVCLRSDRAGNIYACVDGTIIKYDGTGKTQTTFSGQGFPTDYFTDTAVLLDNSVLAYSDMAGEDDLVKLDTKGKQTKRVLKFISSQTDDAVTIVQFVADGLGNVYATDDSSGYIFKFGSDGKYINRFGGKGDNPGQFDGILEAIAVDRQSHVYVGDFNGIQVFDSDGHFIKTIPMPDHSAVYGMAFNSKGQLYVVGLKSKIYRLDVGSNSNQ